MPVTLPSPDEVNLPGRVLFRSGTLPQVPGAALRLGEGAIITDKWWGCLGDESQNPCYWPTSKSVGDFDWTHLNPSFDNINLNSINNQKLADLFKAFLTTVDVSSLSSLSNFIQNVILNKPAYLTLWVDSQNGSDNNDGSSPSKAYKTLDAALDKTTAYSLQVYLINDNNSWDVRRNIYNPFINIQGVSVDANGNINGYIRRSITLRGEARNSPAFARGRCNAGAFLYGSSLSFDHAYVVMPDHVDGVVVIVHFECQNGGNVIFSQSAIAPTSANCDVLIGSGNNAQCGGWFSGSTISANANGHLFSGIAAGQNPNSSRYYRSDLESA